MSSKKSAKRIVRDHDPEILKAAIDDVKIKGISMRRAAKLYNIPMTTLYDKVTGKQPLIYNRTLLTKDEEKKLAMWLLELVRFGFSKTSLEIRETVQAIVAARKNNSENEGQIGLPHRQWLYGFMNRHPELPPSIDTRRKKEIVSPSAVELWFKKFQESMDSIDPTIFTSPNRIFNADEMAFEFDTKSKNVKTCKGSKHAYKMTPNTQTQVTVLACCNAVGQYIPPLLIYPCKDTPTHNLLEKFPEALLQLSDNGWITSAFFFNWLKNIFIPSTNHLPKPILLLVDAHTSHTSFLEISPICSQNNIILYCLLPNASCIIQPLNQTFLSSFKAAWYKALKQHIANTDKGVNLKSFAGVLKSVWNKVTTPEIAADSFRAAGIFPLNPSKIIKSKKLWLKQACSSEATEDDILKSPCTSQFQGPSDGYVSSLAPDSTYPDSSKLSTTLDQPESTTSPAPSKYSASLDSPESSTPLKLEDSCETSASLALAETSTSHFKLSFDDSNSLVSPDAVTTEASLENPSSTSMTYSVQQVTALKEHSYFICNELPESSSSSSPSKAPASASYPILTSLILPKTSESSTVSQNCIPTSLAETSTSHSASTHIFSLDDVFSLNGSTSLVSPETSTSQGLSENPISSSPSYDDQQITALKEHSLFMCKEMTEGELSIFFARLTNPQTQILFDPHNEKKFQRFKALTRFIAQAFKTPVDPSPKTSQAHDNIFILPTLNEKGKMENGSHTLACPVKGKEFRLSLLKRKSSVEEDIERKEAGYKGKWKETEKRRKKNTED